MTSESHIPLFEDEDIETMSAEEIEALITKLEDLLSSIPYAIIFLRMILKHQQLQHGN